jgi:hypothetical protein
VAELQHCRLVLLRVLNDISNEQLDFQIFPDSQSIGELLLHIGGFEFLIIFGAGLLTGSVPDHQLWQSVKPGFARQIGCPPPRGRSLKQYLDTLVEVRDNTLRHFDESPERRVISKATFPFGRLVARLREDDPDQDVEHYEKLSVGIRKSFSDDGAENERGEVDLVNLLQLHEAYHRGHITMQKYLYARVQQRSNGHGELFPTRFAGS